MRTLRLIFLLIAHTVALATLAQAQEQQPQLIVSDPFVEMHTGPGRGYPVFHVAERGSTIELLRRRTDWFQVRAPRGEEGWVHYDQLLTTVTPDGEPFGEPGFTLEDFEQRTWEAGFHYGDFGGANVISAFGAFGMTPNLTGEVSVSHALGRFSDSKMINFNIVHLMYPERRASPFFTLGAGAIKTSPKATLVATLDREDAVAHAGIGVRTYLTRRFVFRAEYKTYVVFTSRDDNEEIREWKAGFSFFF